MSTQQQQHHELQADCCDAEQPPWAGRYHSSFSYGEQQEQQQHHQEQQRDKQYTTPWPIPNTEHMAERWQHRQRMLQETEAHLRVHPHGGLGATGRNIMHLLYDRQLRGPGSMTCRAHWQRSHYLLTTATPTTTTPSTSSNSGEDDSEKEGDDNNNISNNNSNNSDNAQGGRGGRRGPRMPKSPSTVLLEASGTEAMETNNLTTLDTTEMLVEQQQYDSHNPQPPPCRKST